MRNPLETAYAYPPCPEENRPDDVSRQVIQHIEDKYGGTPSITKTAAPLALYIHIPFCLHFCHFCGFVKKIYSQEDCSEYVDLLLREMEILSKLFPIKNAISSIYFGGGSASTLEPHQIARILKAIHKNFDVAICAELSFEGECLSLGKRGYLQSLSEFGFNRISFGVQILNQHARRALNLRPTAESLSRVGDGAMRLFKDVCIDYMYCWPGFSESQVRADLNEVLRRVPCTAVEAFRFEILDASPELVAAFSSRYLLPAQYENYKAQYSAVSDVLKENDFARTSYTIFNNRTRSKSSNPVYYNCYYGWDQSSVIGIGLGAQSFWHGAMWGAVSDWTAYLSRLSANRLPYHCYTPFDQRRKELTTWPRRGWIDLNKVRQAGPGYAAKIDKLIAHRFCHEKKAGLHLDEQAWPMVPAMIHYLAPASDRRRYESLSLARANERGLSASNEAYNAEI